MKQTALLMAVATATVLGCNPNADTAVPGDGIKATDEATETVDADADAEDAEVDADAQDAADEAEPASDGEGAPDEEASKDSE